MICFEKDCKEPVAYSFVWPWGVPAQCCSKHRLHAQQKSDALERGPLNFTVLEPNKAQPLSRDERTQLIAARMSADEEIKLLQARATMLYNQNTELQAELRRLRGRSTETEAQLKDRAADLDRVIRERDEALADVAETRQELERVQMLIPRDAPHETRHVVG